MATPNIDTFEHDIAEEITHKEASIGDIASAGGDVGNTPTAARSTGVIVGISLLALCLIVALVLGGYVYYAHSTALPAPAPGNVVGLEPDVDPGLPLTTISRTLDDNVGRFLTHVTQSPNGYSMTVTSYSPVFAYMNTHEADFAEELATAVGSPRDNSTSTPPFMFTDITVDNQNMRIGTSASSTIVYAFANTQLLLVASTPEKILALRDAILR